jgi:hypothetical protein
MRTLHLIVAEFNKNNIKLGNNTMTNAKEANKLPDQQARFENIHLSTAAALNKVLAMDLLPFLPQAGGLCSNDAKCCYDCIVHWIAIVCLIRPSMPYEPMLSMFETLQSTLNFMLITFLSPLVNMAGIAGPLFEARDRAIDLAP